MIGIVIVAHGGLAKEYLAAVEHVLGPQTDIVPIAMDAECDREAKQEEICKAADSVDQGDGVIVVVDMFGSSPSNLSMKACNCTERKILYGANLPMLVKLAKSRHRSFEKAVAAAVEAGRKYINTSNGINAA
ncbi:MAG: PTS fructose transporter subunit IIA [Rhodobacteraceae bacterium]|nr:PTS fructose transporter subunit IIA [Paracoccaceae bacterium]